LWIGKLPDWRVHVDATRREDYDTGEAKQWYSDLSVLDGHNHVLAKQQISVNNPLSYGGVDIYQSSWGLDHINLSFNGHHQSMQLRPMGKRFAAFLPLDQTSILIFSVKSQNAPLRLFAKRQDWGAPRLIVEMPPGATTKLGDVAVRFDGVTPITGLQYKCDPGLPIIFVAFGFIICGVLLATVPHRLTWASVNEVGDADGDPVSVLSAGGRSVKSRVGFERSMEKLMQTIRNDLGVAIDRTIGDGQAPSASEQRTSAIEIAATTESSNLATLAGGKGTNV
jgi:cytochrome c biogenesis protein